MQRSTRRSPARFASCARNFQRPDCSSNQARASASQGRLQLAQLVARKLVIQQARLGTVATYATCRSERYAGTGRPPDQDLRRDFAGLAAFAGFAGGGGAASM